MIYNKLLVAFFLIAFWTININAQTYTENRKIVKIFKAGKSTTVDITNKYGKIHVIPWDKDSVRFEINLTIKSQNNSRLKKLKNNIDFDFTRTEYYITVKTTFGSKYSSFLSDLKNLAETFIPSYQVSIDYTVTMPNDLNLKINNKFGDIFTDDYKGELNIILSNGDLKANKLSGNTNIDIKIGDGVINSIKNGKIFISYSEFRIKKADQLNINSRSSKINIDTVNVLKTHSRRDKYYISEINNLFGETYFSYLWIYKLNNELNFKLKYGNLNLEFVNPQFSFLNINSAFADLNLFFARQSNYQIDITHKNVNLNYPREIAKLQEKSINNDEKQFLTFGTIGTADYFAKVKIYAERCDINIIHK